MKNLANCTPREFLKQSNKIRHAVDKWLKVTDVVKIYKTAPEIPKDVSPEQEQAAKEEQARENLNRILDVVMDEHPDETLDLLAMLCFIEPEDIDNHPIAEYLAAVGEMLGNSSVISFFMSLIKLGQMNTLKA